MGHYPPLLQPTMVSTPTYHTPVAGVYSDTTMLEFELHE